MKRPGTGLIGHYIDIVVGKKIKRDFNKDYQNQKKIYANDLYIYRLNKRQVDHVYY